MKALDGTEIQYMSKMYDDAQGNLEVLARVTGLTHQLMLDFGAADGRDWGMKALDGTYAADLHETVKNELRTKLRSELAGNTQKLKRTRTKVLNGKAMPEDIARLAE